MEPKTAVNTAQDKTISSLKTRRFIFGSFWFWSLDCMVLQLSMTWCCDVKRLGTPDSYPGDNGPFTPTLPQMELLSPQSWVPAQAWPSQLRIWPMGDCISLAFNLDK